MESEARERGYAMRLGLTVSAVHNGHKEERHFLDPMAAFEQGDLLRATGYPQVIFHPTYFTYDDGQYYLVTVERSIQITEQATPSRYQRADLNPGINVRRYDREVLKRPRTTGAETVVITAIMLALSVMVLAPLVAGLSEVARMMRSDGYRDETLPALMMLGAIYVGFIIRWANPAVCAIEKWFGIPSVEEWYAN